MAYTCSGGAHTFGLAYKQTEPPGKPIISIQESPDLVDQKSWRAKKKRGMK